MKYNVFFANVITENNTGRTMEIVAISEAAAKADIMEAFAGVKDVQLGWLRYA